MCDLAVSRSSATTRQLAGDVIALLTDPLAPSRNAGRRAAGRAEGNPSGAALSVPVPLGAERIGIGWVPTAAGYDPGRPDPSLGQRPGGTFPLCTARLEEREKAGYRWPWRVNHFLHWYGAPFGIAFFAESRPLTRACEIQSRTETNILD